MLKTVLLLALSANLYAQDFIHDALEHQLELELSDFRENPLTFKYAYKPLNPKGVKARNALLSYGEWKRNITSTVFWVGESASKNNPTHNRASSWDTSWMLTFGGTDHPTKRNGFYPQGFVPKQNPFYIALPYNDMKGGKHRPEASSVIPWFWDRYHGPARSVCHGMWLSIHKDGKICYAQWRDVGPFYTDDWQYVFGNKLPRYNKNASAGIDLSPAIRDYLGTKGIDSVDWKFVHENEVPAGPWKGW